VFGAVDFANQERFPDAVLEKLLSHFEKIGLRNADVPADVLGDAYLYLITMFAEGAGGCPRYSAQTSKLGEAQFWAVAHGCNTHE
jgi:hypothetical protein